ncbi:PKD domain-containing protein [Thermodesulfatator autotrophicus]|uniref:PKD domain-containing protein n=1 Tax=Thermodesulfatator autotrophicus TaxID=1795632 RepID=A0A177E5P2_9BACT|nr:PKD domain-containing protein [Thermodesulfatator autotrophicus]OAG26760.1 hypothetical protein TH606_10600 [Thermodesulfatator autotrophicus]
MRRIIIIAFLFLMVSVSVEARIYVNPSIPQVDQTVRFTLRVSNCPNLSNEILTWDFGDGTKRSGRNLTTVTHTFRRSGTFTIKVYSSGPVTSFAARNPCQVQEKIVIKVARSKPSASPSDAHTIHTPPVSNKPSTSYQPPTSYRPPIKRVKVEILEKKRLRNNQGFLKVKILCEGDYINGEFRLNRWRSSFPLSRSSLSLDRGQFKTISIKFPVRPQEKKVDLVILDEDRREVKRLTVELPPSVPDFFWIAGFKFTIDHQRNCAVATLPFRLNLSPSGVSSPGTNISSSISSGTNISPVLSGGGGGIGTPITVNLQEIRFQNFRLNNRNEVTQGSFEVQINRAVITHGSGKVLYLKSINFSPTRAQAQFELHLGSRFNPSSLSFTGGLRGSQRNFTLSLKSPTLINYQNQNQTLKARLSSAEILFSAGRLDSRVLRGEILLPGKVYPAQGRFEWAAGRDETGLWLEAQPQQETVSFMGQEINISLSSFKPLWEKELANNLKLIAQKLVLDWSPFSSPDNSYPVSMMDIFLGQVFLRVPVNLLAPLPWVDFPSENSFLRYGLWSGHFKLKDDASLVLLAPRNLEIRVLKDSAIDLSGGNIASWRVNMAIYLPSEFKNQSGQRVRLDCGSSNSMSQGLSFKNSTCYIREPFYLADNSKLVFNGATCTLSADKSGGELSFESAILRYTPIQGVRAKGENLVLDGSGFHGHVKSSQTSSSSLATTTYNGFPLTVKKFTVEIEDSKYTRAVFEGRIKFPILNNISRSFSMNLLDEHYYPLAISKDPSDESFRSEFFDIDPLYGLIVSFQGTTLAQIYSDLDIHLPFGISTTISGIPVNLGANSLSAESVTVGDIWDFYGLSGQISQIKLYSEAGKVFLEVQPTFSIGFDWMSFPLSAPLRFYADGQVSGVAGEGSVSVEMEGFRYSGSVSAAVDSDFNIYFEGQGEMYLLTDQVGVQSEFLFNHRRNDFDYWRIKAKATGLNVPLGNSGLVLKGVGGGLAFNMEGNFNMESFEVSYTPSSGHYGLESLAEIATKNAYLFFARTLLSLGIHDSGTEGTLTLAGKAWIFDRKHKGTPNGDVLIVGNWGSNPSFMAEIQGQVKIKHLLNAQARGDSKILLYAAPNNQKLMVGSQANPWSIELLELFESRGYLEAYNQGGSVSGKLGYGMGVNLEKRKKIKGVCTLRARAYGWLQGDSSLSLYPSIRYYEKNTVNLGASVSCGSFGVGLGGGILKEVSAPEPLKFLLGMQIDIDLGFYEKSVLLGINLLEPANWI